MMDPQIYKIRTNLDVHKPVLDVAERKQNKSKSYKTPNGYCQESCIRLRITEIKSQQTNFKIQFLPHTLFVHLPFNLHPARPDNPSILIGNPAAVPACV